MTKKIQDNQDRTVDLLEKLLVFQLYTLGATQKRIAKIVGRKMAWINELVKEMPKGGNKNGSKA